MKNFTTSLQIKAKGCLQSFAVLVFLLISQSLFAQKVIIIGATMDIGNADEVAFVVNIPLAANEVVFINDYEYNTTTHQFGDAGAGTVTETIIKYIAPAGGLAKGQVVTINIINQSNPNSLVVACTSGSNCGTATLLTADGTNGFRSGGESIYAYSDSDNNPQNGVTEIYSVIYLGSESLTNSGGTIPAAQNPVTDYPNAVVIDNFPAAAPLRTEFNGNRAASVSKAMLQNTSNYAKGAASSTHLDKTVFANLNLAGANPVLTLAVSPSSVTENGVTNLVYTFTLSANAASDITVNFSVGGTATFNTDYTQTGAASFTTTTGTATIPSGSNTVSVTINPTGDATLEPDETVILTVTTGTGYDAGSPSNATGTITNDDTGTSLPKVALVGINQADLSTNPTHQDGFSFVALDDLASGTVVYFTRRIYDKNTLAFNSTYTSTVKWTAGSGVNRGDVYTVMETSTDVFTVTCSDGSSCGTVTNIDAGFSIPTGGVTLFAYSDNNDVPTDAITEIYSALHTGDLVIGTNGGTIPAISNPTTIYPNAVVIDNFPNATPGRVEYKFPTERQTTVSRTLLTNVTNWLHGQSTATVPSTVRFTNIIVTSGVANPLVTVTPSPSSVLENSGTGMVYTFTLSQNAASNMTINFAVSGTATLTTDYTQTGAASFTSSTGSVVIPSGSNTASVTITPVGETTLEPNETVVLTIDAGTGYDAGNPNVGTGTIANDDYINVNPLIAIVGVNHGANPDLDGISFAANQNLAAGTEIYFTSADFNNTTLTFGTVIFVAKYTVPSGGLAKGQVVYAVETGLNTNLFTMSCSAGSNCGTFAFISGGGFSIGSTGLALYAYTDTDADPTNGVSSIHSLFYSNNSAIPTTANPTPVYPNAVVVGSFGTSTPNRTEYKFASGERSATINLANIQNTANYLIGQTTQDLSVIPFAALNLCPASISTNPSSTAICVGTNTAFSVVATGSGLSYQWQVNTGSGFTNITNGGIYSGATSATLTLTNVPIGNNGYTYQCVVNDCATSTAATLTVNALPTITVSSSPAICSGATSFTIPYTSTTGTPTTYSISGTGITTVTDGALPATPITVNLSAGASGSSISYTLIVKNANCTSSNIIGSVTVNALPSITTSASAAICTGATSFTIPYTGTTGTPTTYSISGTGITTVTDGALPATPITVNLSSGASGSSISYTLTVKNANGCTSSSVTGSVTVNAAPSITTSASAAICAGATSFTIPYTATTGTPTTYSISGTGITTVTDATLPATPITVNLSSGASGSSISYTLTVKNANGCTSSNVVGSVTVNPLPTITTSASPAICTGATSFTIPYTATSNSPTTYSISGAGITTVTDATLPATPITVNLSSGASGSSISYTLTVKNANGCTSSNIVGSVTVNALPTASPGSNTPVCVGNTLNLTSTTATSYLWTGPNSFSGTTQNPNISNVSIVEGGTYTLRVTNAGGCTATATTSVVINSTPAPTAPTATPSTVTVSGNTVTLTATGCSSPSTITWYDSSNPSVALPNNTPAITATKTFFAKCTGTNTCVSDASTTVTVTYNPCTPLASSPGNVGINWTGLVSTDWNNACNWNPAWVPDATNSAVVIGLQTNQPTITGTVPTVNVIYINANAILTVSSGGTLNSNSNVAAITLQGGSIINDGTINVSGSGSGVGFVIGATASITNRGTITTNNLYGVSLNFGNLTFTNESTGIYNGDIKANNNILTLTNHGTINYARGTFALSLGSVGSSVINDGTISITAGSGISNPSGSTITNNACGKIVMTTGEYQNGGTTINRGLIQMPNLYNFTNTGTFTNNGVLKANTVSSITNNKMVITNTCPIFTLGNDNNYTVSGIFTDAAATNLAGDYDEANNKFTANNTLPTGTQTLYAQVTDIPGEGVCTFVVPFNFDNKKPTAVSVNNTAICTGTSVTLSGTCPSGTTLTWYTAATGGTSIGTGTNLSNSPTVATTYYAACEATNCISGRVATSEVTVSNPPPASAISNSPICAGATLNLSSGSEGNTYLWTGPNSFTSTDLSPSIANASVSATGTYTITITNSSNCTSTATTAVTVNAVPTATASSNSPVCAGGSISLTGGGVGSYFWTGPGGYSSALQSPTIANATVSMTGTYTITVTNSNSCTSTATVAVTVNANPTATASSSTPTICAGNTISLSGGGVGTYAWTGVNGFTSTDQNPTISNATVSASGTYKVTVTNLSGCTSTAMTSVTVNAVPTATASSNSPVCVGNTISLTGGGVGTYSWTGVNGFSSTDQNPTIPNATVLASGTYKITVTNVNGCTSTAMTSVTVNALPTATASSNSPVCVGNTISLTGGGVGTYSWTGVNGFNSTDQNPTIPNASLLASGTYKITVTNVSGCTSTAMTSVTVNAVPTATASSSTPTICAGNSISLSGGGGGTYSWTGVNGFSSTDQNPTIPNATVLASGTYKITVTNVNGCTSTAMTSVTVNANPTATASSNSPVCVGNTISLTGGGIGTYAWTGVNGFNSTDQNPTIPNASLSASGTYKITVTNVNGCTSTAMTSVTVNSTPTTTAGNNSPICAGGTLNLTSGAGFSSYAWTGVNGFSSTDQNPSISNASLLASGTYKVMVTNVSGCTSTAMTSVTVNALPTATASSNSPICSGATLNLTGGGVGTAYAWTSSTGFTSSAQSPTITNATVSVTGTYTITVTNANGCTSTASVAVTVNALPTATASSNSPICAGTTLNLTSGGVGTAYAWTSSNGFTSNVQSPTISNATVSSTGTYTITVTNANGCTSTATVAVTVNSLPTATASSNSPICSGTSLNLTGGGVGTAYAWTSSTGFTSTAQSPTISNATVLATGTYTITVTNVNGCTSTASVAVTVNALPTATASSNSPICSGTTLNLTGGGVGSAYAWTSSTGFTSTAQSPTISNATVSATGTYTITVTNANGCTSTASVAVIVNPVVNAPTPQSDTQIIFGGSVSLTATGCSGSSDVLKWYQTADNVQVTMPVSPTVTTQYYAKCEVTANGITCISPNSNNVTVTVLQPQPPVATGATICTGGSVTLTATGCSGSTGTFVLKWYLNATDALVTMPVSPTTNTDYYAKCEQTFNSVTAISAKSNVVTVTVLNPVAPVATGGTIYSGNSITLTATGCTGSGFVIKWYQTADNVEVTMPVSPTLATQYYAKCEQTANSVTCLSAKSNDVTVVVVNRIFVDITKVAAPIQNGNSWATAYGNLQTGLSAAAAVVVSAPAEVWVAQGTYKPTTTTTRTIYFNIPSGVKVYGGFVGTENDLATRNFRTNTTILSGDIGTIGKDSDNSYHVVNFDASNNNTLLDGFTITGGFASYDPNRIAVAPGIVDLTTTSVETGGGIVVQNAGLPTIANCTIVNNAAVMGGGSFTADASLPKFVACKIMSNRATFGGGVYFQDGSNGSLSNCLISGNQGTGAVYNNKSNTQIMNCTIAGNGGYNGGIFNSVSQPVVKNSIIWNNSTPFNDTQSIITYSTVQGGYAGTGNLSFDPKFVNPVPNGLAPNANGDYHLQASSLAIDRGDNTGISLTDVDLDGNLRRYNGGTVDMGAYEFQGVATSNLIISAQTGNWETNSTWVGFKVPALGDVVIIDSNHIVTINTTATAKSIEYRGTGQVKFNSNTAKLNIGF